MGAYGYPRATTPNIDALAARGVVFEATASAAAWTKPSVPSYFTGRYPRQHGVYQGSRTQGGKLTTDVLAETEQTLAEVFQAGGYQTVGVVANSVIKGNTGLAQGFDTYAYRDTIAEGIRAMFEQWLDQREASAPFFAYVHFNDVHLPYEPPGEYRTAFGDGTKGAIFSSDSWKLVKREIREGKRQIAPDDQQGLIDLYDGELRYTDAQIGELLADLDRRGLLDHTLVVVISDHGEELLDRGGIDHGSSLYDELIDVPLILRFPGDAHAGLRVSEPASLVDLLPTVVDFAGLEIPPDVAGRSLLPQLAEGPAEPAPLFSEGIHRAGYQQAIRLGDWKYIVTTPAASTRKSGTEHAKRAKQLTPGLRVELAGLFEDGHFKARKVEIKEDQEAVRDEVTGPVERVDPAAGELVVFGYEVHLQDGALLKDHLGDPIELAALTPGTFVKIYGRARSASEFEANRVKVRAPERRRKIKLEGPIVGEVRVEGGGKRSFECAGRPVSLSRKTEIEHEGEEAIAVGAQTADPWTTARSGSTPTREELYNLAADPEERQDLSRSHPDQLTRMRSALAAARTPSSLPVAPTRELSSDEIEALRKLGYVE